jgi:hypothetical protein
MPQLNRVAVFNNDFKIKKPTSVFVNISPAIVGSNTIIDLRDLNGVLTLNTFGSYNLTPISTFSANVLVWGAGGAHSTGNGGAGGFSTGGITFNANVSYNVVVGRAGSSGSGGGGSGIEYLTNSVPIIVAGGGGGGGSGRGGAGGGWFAQNGGGANGASSFGFVSPGSFKLGSPSAGSFGFGAGGAGGGGGGGGLYGGGASGAGGGGGGGFLNFDVMVLANTETGANNIPPNASYPDRGLNGNGGVSPGTAENIAGDGMIILLVQ